jgi:hypothetical protein
MEGLEPQASGCYEWLHQKTERLVRIFGEQQVELTTNTNRRTRTYTEKKKVEQVNHSPHDAFSTGELPDTVQAEQLHEGVG